MVPPSSLPPHLIQASADELSAAANAALLAGRAREALALFEEAWRRLARTAPPSAVSATLRSVARAYHAAGDAEAALDVLTIALAVAELAGDPAGIGHAVNAEAIIHMQRGRLDEAETLYTRARRYAILAGETRLAALVAQNLSIVASIRGDEEVALRHCERAISEFRLHGLAREASHALSNLGILHAGLGRLHEAERAYSEAIHIASVLGDLAPKAMMHVNLAELCIARGDLPRARRECDAAMALARQLADARVEGEAEKLYGMIARETGELAAAEAHLVAAEALAVAAHNVLLEAEVARERADLHERQGRNRDVLQCLNRAHRLFTQLRARRDLADVARRTGRLEDEFLEVARRWGESIEAKDRYTQGHCERVADLACDIAHRAGLDERSLFWFRIGALLHDVGKLLVPEEVLNKPGKLTPEEWALVRSHPAAGVEMLADVEFPWDVRPIVLSHHERWDGKGYPQGLRAEEIPLTARILCVADIYDALTSVRSYKRALSHDEAMALLRKDVGTIFDPQVFAWFEEVAPAWEARSAAGQSAALRTPPRGVPRQAAPGYDPLTGLPAAALLREEVDRILASRGTDAEPVSLIVVRVADDATDGALVRVAEALCRNTSGGSEVGRVERLEFAVILPDVPLAEACVLADRLRCAAAEATAPRGLPGLPSAVWTGVATTGHGAHTAAALIAAASERAAPESELAA